MADPINAIEEYKKENNLDVIDSTLYDAFMEGWRVGDQLKRPEPPHRIFDSNVDDEKIRRFYDAGRQKYQELTY